MQTAFIDVCTYMYSHTMCMKGSICMRVGAGSSRGSRSRAKGSKGDDGDSDESGNAVALRVDDGYPSLVHRGSPLGLSSGEEKDRKTAARDRVKSIFWYIKACVVGGLYPQVATIQAPRTYLVSVIYPFSTGTLLISSGPIFVSLRPAFQLSISPTVALPLRIL